jgi:hypothetical protein
LLLVPGIVYRGAAGDAALGRARAADRARDWDAAAADYTTWMAGIRDGAWPLHRNGLQVAPYVARRLRDRGEVAARGRWVDLCAAALESAASRDELAREARYARFGILLADERWNDAYETLRVLRSRHDPEGRDGGLVVAEASLLAWRARTRASSARIALRVECRKITVRQRAPRCRLAVARADPGPQR